MGVCVKISDGKTRLHESMRLSSPKVHQKVHYPKPHESFSLVTPAVQYVYDRLNMYDRLN